MNINILINEFYNLAKYTYFNKKLFLEKLTSKLPEYKDYKAIYEIGMYLEKYDKENFNYSPKQIKYLLDILHQLKIKPIDVNFDLLEKEINLALRGKNCIIRLKSFIPRPIEIRHLPIKAKKLHAYLHQPVKLDYLLKTDLYILSEKLDLERQELKRMCNLCRTLKKLNI